MSERVVLRTPEERFDDLPDFPFTPHYVKLLDIRVHYVDEGPAAGEVVLCLHGEPTWSYLYRHIIPPLAARYRVIAPDFVGFGRSDKYAEVGDYSFQLHRDTLVAFIETLDLRGITAVVQDWGGLIGLTVATQLPDRFARLVIMNTFLPTGEERATEAFLRWRAFVERVGTRLPVARVIRGGLARPEGFSDAAAAAYEAPFPDAAYKAGAVAWPLLVPLQPDEPGAAEMRAARAALREWSKPALVLFSDGDPVTGPAAPFFQRLIPTTTAFPPVTIRGAGHFLQEEAGPEIAAHIGQFIAATAVTP